MFFLIGAITPKIKRLEGQPMICPRCGQVSFYRVRLDHQLSLFFIPICSIKKGQPFFLCQNCRLESPEPTASSSDYSGQSSYSRAGVCPRCSHQLEADFHYCPFCGQALK